MTRKTKTSKRAESYANRAIKTSRAALLDDVCEGMYKEYINNNNRLPYGHVTNLLNELKPTEEWLTRNIINKSFMKYKAAVKQRLEEKTRQPSRLRGTVIGGSKLGRSSPSMMSEISNVSSTFSSKIGRPLGSTEAFKEKRRQDLINAKNVITRKYSDLMRDAKENGNGRVRKGALKEIIEDVRKKRRIDEDISPLAIRKRVVRNSLVNHHLAGGQVSPLEKIEPIIVNIIVQMARMRQCLTPSKGLMLVNSLITGTRIQSELVAWKRNNTPNFTGTLGPGYWQNFMKRNKHKIVGKRGQKYELSRQNWTTYNNFVSMYNHIIDELVHANLAVKLETPTWMNRNGEVCTEEEAYGCKVHHVITRPELCFCGDEVGGNISMKGDGHNGGELLLTEKGKVPQRKASTRSRKFTMIGLTSFSGEPVMCVLIIEGKLPNGSIESGVDITINPDGQVTDKDFIIKNSGAGKYFPGGPECLYRGKKVPALVRWHESASITSDILVDMLKTLDQLGVIPRDDNVKPLILLDGHRSRLELPFLKYVNDPEDHWIACIGVPYGTALWQVGDSKEQNGSFNMAMTREKQKLLEYKDTIGLQNDGIVDTDLMPLVNRAWAESFARVDKNRNAISERGWNPLNKALLLDPVLRSTMTAKEKTDEFNQANQIIIPNKHNKVVTDEDPFISTETTISHTSTSTTVTDTDHSSINNPPSGSDELNFSSGMSQYCLKAYLTNEQL